MLPILASILTCLLLLYPRKLTCLCHSLPAYWRKTPQQKIETELSYQLLFFFITHLFWFRAEHSTCGSFLLSNNTVNLVYQVNQSVLRSGVLIECTDVFPEV